MDQLPTFPTATLDSGVRSPFLYQANFFFCAVSTRPIDGFKLAREFLGARGISAYTVETDIICRYTLSLKVRQVSNPCAH